MKSRIEILHDKFISSTISKEEKQELFMEYEDMFRYPDGTVDYGHLETFLAVTHESYGKPDKDGKTSIV